MSGPLSRSLLIENASPQTRHLFWELRPLRTTSPAFLSWQRSVFGLPCERSWYKVGADPVYQPNESGEEEIVGMLLLVSWPLRTCRRLCLKCCRTVQKALAGCPGERHCPYRLTGTGSAIDVFPWPPSSLLFGRSCRSFSAIVLLSTMKQDLQQLIYQDTHSALTEQQRVPEGEQSICEYVKWFVNLYWN